MKRNALKWGLAIVGLAGVGVMVSRLVRARRRAGLPDQADAGDQD